MKGTFMKRPLAVLACSLLLATIASPGASPASAQPDPLGAFSSDNLSLVTSIPNPGIIGARFRGNLMYATSVSGLTIYDVTTPAAPTEIGRLALPHFENEDVDLGGNILLISNDAAESTGILYVIDISDPRNPTQMSKLDMGGNPVLGGPGHTASCILSCRYAWVTDGAGIRVIDLTNPAAPVSKGTFATAAGGGIVTHDVQIDENGLAWVVGFGGAVVYELPSDYSGNGLGTQVAKTNAQGDSTYISELGLGDGSKPNDYILHNSRRFKDSDVLYVTEEDYNRPGCKGAGAFETWDIPLKYEELEDGEIKVSLSGQPLAPKDMWTTELNEAPRDSVAAMCSAHYFDVLGNIVIQGWYEQGLRVLDVSKPGDIRQIGFYAPGNAMTWAAYFAPTDPTGEILYVFDASHGIDVLRLDRPSAGPLSHPHVVCTADCLAQRPPTLRAPIRMSWLVGVPTGIPDKRFGYACRII